MIALRDLRWLSHPELARRPRLVFGRMSTTRRARRRRAKQSPPRVVAMPARRRRNGCVLAADNLVTPPFLARNQWLPQDKRESPGPERLTRDLFGESAWKRC